MPTYRPFPLMLSGGAAVQGRRYKAASMEEGRRGSNPKELGESDQVDWGLARGLDLATQGKREILLDRRDS